MVREQFEGRGQEEEAIALTSAYWLYDVEQIT